MMLLSYSRVPIVFISLWISWRNTVMESQTKLVFIYAFVSPTYRNHARHYSPSSICTRLRPDTNSLDIHTSTSTSPKGTPTRKRNHVQTRNTRRSALNMISSQPSDYSSGITVFGRRILSEDDLASPPDSRVIQVIESNGGGPFVASDVATKAGVSISIARKSLASLATLTRGNIAVTNDGILIYTFPKGIQSILSANSARYRLLQTWTKAWPKIFYLIRVGFGVMLFVNLFLVFSTLLFISVGTSSSSDSSDDRNDRRRANSSFNTYYGGGSFFQNFMWDLIFPRNYFMYRPYYGYYGRYDPFDSQQSFNQSNDSDQPNMFERIFSYIFGDGNPNRALQDAKLRGAAELIRNNGGVVIAEQLIPYLDLPPSPSSISDSSTASYVDESFVLPIVSQLGGEPVVTDDGDIVYVFPDLQVSANSNAFEMAGLPLNASNASIKKVLMMQGVDTRAALERKDLIRLLEKTFSSPSPTNIIETMDENDLELLQERNLAFNQNGFGWNLFAGILGVLNLYGSVKLNQILMSPSFIGSRLPGVYGLIPAALPFILTYAVLFNLVPIVRFIWNMAENANIAKRNENRKASIRLVSQQSESFHRKVKAALSLGKRIRRINTEKVLFDTSMDSLVTEKQKQMDDLNAFDEKLGTDDGK